MAFKNREQAAELLAARLSLYRSHHPLILGIPRGAVPMAKILADRLGGDLDVVLVHKIGAPDNPEFAVGSVSEFGSIYRSEAVEYYEISNSYIEKVAKRELEKLKERRRAYLPIHPPISPKGRFVIIVDDGIATGATVLSAIRAVRTLKPKKILVTAPVASPRTIQAIQREADNVVILETPPEFFSISQFYEEFPQVTDSEVLEILSESREKKIA